MNSLEQLTEKITEATKTCVTHNEINASIRSIVNKLSNLEMLEILECDPDMMLTVYIYKDDSVTIADVIQEALIKMFINEYT